MKQALRIKQTMEQAEQSGGVTPESWQATTVLCAPLFFWVLCGFLILLLLPFILATGYTFPFGDDFKRSLDAAHIFDLWGGVKEMLRAWSRWSGRYTHHFLVIFLGDAVNSRFSYALLCLSHMAFFAGVFYGIISQLAPHLPRKERFFLAFFTLGVLLCSYYPLGLPWYEATDIFGIGLANAFTLLHINALLAVWRARCLTRGLRCFSYLSLVAAAGTYEYATLAILLINLGVFWQARRAGHPQSAFFLRLLKLAFCCFLVSFLAPGNFRRRGKMGLSPEIQAKQIAEVFRVWAGVLLPALLNPFLLYLGVAASWLRARTKAPASRRDTVAVCAFCAMSILILTFFITLIHAFTDVPFSFVAYDKMRPAIMLLCASFFFCAARVLWSMPTKQWAIPFLPFICLAFPLLFYSSNWQSTSWNLGSGAFHEYAQIIQARTKLMARCPGEDCAFPPLSFCPYPACLGEPIAPTQSQWPNKYIARLNNVHSVRLQDWDTARAAQRLAQIPNSRWLAVPGFPQTIRFAWLDPEPLSPDNFSCSGWIGIRVDVSSAPLAERVFALTLRENSFFATLAKCFWGRKESAGREMQQIWQLPFFIQTPLNMSCSKLTALPGQDLVPENGFVYQPFIIHNVRTGPLAAVYLSPDGRRFASLPLNRVKDF